MKKILMTVGAAVAMIILGIGIYQTDASQNSQLLSEAAVKERVASQYPGEIKTIELEESNYKLEIHHEGQAYDLIVDGYDGSVKQLIEGRTLTVKNLPKKEEAEPTDNKPKKTTSNENESEQTQEEPDKVTPTEVNMETTIEKNESKPDRTEQKENKEKKPVKKQEKEQPKKESKKQASDKEKQQKKVAISEADAIEIALSEFPGEIEQIDLEEDDGQLMYEIEVKRDDREAEIGIDAYSGEVIYMEIDD